MCEMECFADFHALDIYPIPLPAPSRGSDRWLLYSPLAGSAVLADRQDLNLLAEQLKDQGRLDEGQLQSMLIENRVIPQFGYARTPYDVYALTILPNNICNFSCNYCYAAAGHGKEQLDEQTIRTVLDFFVDPARLKRRDLYISFGGGGEPFLSWELVKFSVDYSAELAAKYGFTIGYSFASNGSVISCEIIDTIKKYGIKPDKSLCTTKLSMAKRLA